MEDNTAADEVEAVRVDKSTWQKVEAVGYAIGAVEEKLNVS
jgi:hypothetical protein